MTSAPLSSQQASMRWMPCGSGPTIGIATLRFETVLGVDRTPSTHECLEGGSRTEEWALTARANHLHLWVQPVSRRPPAISRPDALASRVELPHVFQKKRPATPHCEPAPSQRLSVQLPATVDARLLFAATPLADQGFRLSACIQPVRRSLSVRDDSETLSSTTQHRTRATRTS